MVVRKAAVVVHAERDNLGLQVPQMQVVAEGQPRSVGRAVAADGLDTVSEEILHHRQAERQGKEVGREGHQAVARESQWETDRLED